MDVATIKGVIDRLHRARPDRDSPDPEDGRRLLVSLTRAGQQMAEKSRAERARDHQGDACGRSMPGSARRWWRY